MRFFSAGPSEIFASLWKNRQLVFQMSRREAIGRYKGSFIGLAWSFFNPLLMLAIYTFVFSVVFQSRWDAGGHQGKTAFAVILFVGIIVHGLFAECLNRAPDLILSNPGYVKKIVFPLEILPWVIFFSALFHASVSLLVLVGFQVFSGQTIPFTAVLFPIVLLPLVFFSIGFAWFVSALGVYFRDVSQMTSIFTTVLMYVSAVFFPISALPEEFQSWLRLNPLAVIIEQSRQVLIFDEIPDAGLWARMLALGVIVAACGFAWFQKTRKGFADVI